MLYLGFQAHSDIMDPLRVGAGMLVSMLGARVNGSHGLRYAAAACELFAKTRLTHERPSYGIKTIAVGYCEVAVREEPVLKTRFGTLLRFRKNVSDEVPPKPRVLLVALLSGHFATLLRGHRPDAACSTTTSSSRIGTARGMSGVDQHGAVRVLRCNMSSTFIRFLLSGDGSLALHVVAVLPALRGRSLVAVAIMVKGRKTRRSRASMTLMAGPVDAHAEIRPR